MLLLGTEELVVDAYPKAIKYGKLVGLSLGPLPYVSFKPLLPNFILCDITLHLGGKNDCDTVVAPDELCLY
eukprot:SAG11_NODE_4769_length_1774_cov_12.072836_1_plen_70_part_10